MEINKKILEKICEVTGRNFDSLKYFIDLTGFDAYLTQCMVRGFLLDMEVAKAVFGEEEYGWYRGYNEWGKITDPGEEDLTSLRLKAFQYHATQMVFLSSNSEILKYYERYL